MELISTRQGADESISSFTSRYSKKRDELLACGGVEIDDTVQANLFVLCLNGDYRDFQNMFRNSLDDESDFLSAREVATKWSTTKASAPTVLAIRAPAPPQARKDKGGKKKPNKGCFCCGSTEHLVKDCPEIKQARSSGATKAAAGGGSGGYPVFGASSGGASNTGGRTGGGGGGGMQNSRVSGRGVVAVTTNAGDSDSDC
jgi:hypothetical protein